MQLRESVRDERVEDRANETTSDLRPIVNRLHSVGWLFSSSTIGVKNTEHSK
jgi:hypothetical protein